MENKRSKNILNMASKLDALTDSDGLFTKLSLSIVENNDDSATREICKKIADIAETENKQTIQVAKALKDAIINYYGYREIKEICNGRSQDSSEEDDKTLEELLDELNELVGLTTVKNTVNDLITYQKIQKIRKEHGLFSQKNTLHLLVT